MADNYEIDVTLEGVFGTGISSVEQTVTSAEPGGTNEITVTLTNGASYVFKVKNGTDGGYPTPITALDQRTDTSKVYIYLGDYLDVFAHLFAHNGTEWKDIGPYGGTPSTKSIMHSYVSTSGSGGLLNDIDLETFLNTVLQGRIDKKLDAPAGGSEGQILTKTATGAEWRTGIDMDDALDGTSQNAVTNRAITTAVETLRRMGTSPIPAATASAMTDTTKIYIYTGTETGYTKGHWYSYDGSAWVDGGAYNTDTTLTVSGAAADAGAVGQEISDLKSDLNEKASVSASGDYVLLDTESGGVAQRYSVPSQSAFLDLKALVESGSGDGLTTAIKSALLQLADFVAYINANGRQYRNALYDALYPAVVVTAIHLNTNSLSFGSLNSTQQLTATTTPSGGAITWSSSNTSVATVSSTGLVTSVGYGNATITATSGNVSATCSIAVVQATVTSISAQYAQSGTVYNTDSLDSLKSDLVVTANYSNGSSETVTDYTLSGTLSTGTSTITVAYGGKTTNFTVTVTEYVAPDYVLPSTYQEVEWIGKDTDYTGTDNKGPYIRTDITAESKEALNGYSIDFEASVTAGYSANPATIIAFSAKAGCYFGAKQNGIMSFGGSATGNSFSSDVVSSDRHTYHMYFTSTAGFAETEGKTATREWSSTGTDAQRLCIGNGSVNLAYTKGFKFYGAIIVKYNNALVARFVPCYRKSDSVIGFYETEGNTFYTTAGSSDSRVQFVKGSDV